MRNNFVEALALFDFPDSSLVASQRATTTVPAQGLYLLNSPFVIRNATAAADRLQAEAEGPCECEQIRRAYLQVFGRPPTDKEESAAEAFLADACPGTERRSGEGGHRPQGGVVGVLPGPVRQRGFPLSKLIAARRREHRPSLEIDRDESCHLQPWVFPAEPAQGGVFGLRLHGVRRPGDHGRTRSPRARSPPRCRTCPPGPSG